MKRERGIETASQRQGRRRVAGEIERSYEFYEGDDY